MKTSDEAIQDVSIFAGFLDYSPTSCRLTLAEERSGLPSAVAKFGYPAKFVLRRWSSLLASDVCWRGNPRNDNSALGILKCNWYVRLMILSFVCLSIISYSAIVTATNDKLPITITASTAICQRQNTEDICTYSGGVKMVQGTATLQAQRVVIYKKIGGKIKNIVSTGEHSHYSKAPENNTQKPFDADADSISIYPDKNLMVLDGNGQMTVGQDKYSGPHIEYKFK